MLVSVRIEAAQGDITTFDVDAIVNAANQRLLAGAGVCGAIFDAAGERDLASACAEIGYCATGDAVVTPGFALPARWITHTVGPVWHEPGTNGEAELLASCYRRSLGVAAEVGARSVAFPAISTGVYRYPSDQAAAVAVDAVRSSDAAVDRVVLVAFDDEALDRYQRLL